MLGITLCSAYARGWLAPSLVALAFMVVILHQSLLLQPRILARRHAVEAARDPVKAARDRRRERWQCWLGLVIGVGLGGFGMIYGLLASGRL